MAKQEQANPIINSPYERPRHHWELDGDGRATDTLLDGRRPSGPYRGVPLPTGSHEHAGCNDDSIEPYAQINAIRDGVASWRKGGYRGVSRMSRRLLEYWSRDAGGGERRPFFCQVDAIETLVWLCEALPSLDGRGGAGKQASRWPLLEALSLANKTWNDSVPRLAVKMATGTGKTWVMAMIILWRAFLAGGRTDILVLTPNLTVRDRLTELDPKLSDMSLYRDLLPPDVPMPPRLHVTVINYQAFHRRSELSINGPDETPSGHVKALLRPHGRPGPARWNETDEKMLDRLLPSHRGAREITIINDEAHHCRRRPLREDADGGPKDEDDAEAALWFGLLLSLKEQGRLGRVFDLSATPMYLKRPIELDSEVFPWTVSDYSLIDAIEAGLVKIPTVPVRDNAEPTKYNLPMWRNVYASLPTSDTKVKHDRMPPIVEDILGKIHESYGKADEAYSKSGITPVMIVVVNSVKTANEFYKRIAGYVERENSRAGAGSKAWHPGRYRLFSNVEADGSGPVVHPPTLLVHSQLDKPADDPEWKKIADAQREFFSPGGTPTRRELVDHIRKAFNTVGRAGQPGEHVRCIVSVSMLSEGWDVRTVTHIFGFRPFGSQLLCEQVAGRALRRTSLRPSAEGTMVPEYARIFGVPFSFMDEGPDNPQPPVDEWVVRTVKGRSRYRIGFPCIASYLLEQPSAAYHLDPKRVGRYEATRANAPTWTEVAGPAGDTATFHVQHRKNQVMYDIANRVLAKFRDSDSGGGDGLERRRIMFASAVLAARQWLAHDAVRCDDIGILAHAPHRERAPEAIAAACVPAEGRAALVPLFADEHDPGRPRMTDTSEVRFETRLERRYPPRGNTAHSELNAAACHTGPELVLAGVLDRHPEVVAWARNYRLGWSVPYFDEGGGRWRMYEPDFVARIRDGAGGPRHLVIEFKGRMDDDAVTKKAHMEEMWIPSVNSSDDPACAGTWRYVIFGSGDTAEDMGGILDRVARAAW